MRTRAQLVREICKREGKKSESSIGNVREIIKIIEILIAEDLIEGFYEDSYAFLILENANKKAIRMKSKMMKGKK